tara:strand:+ start:672 stop:866 length:195 start_codon:yes stop_codon:yes gene_type:complete
MFNVFLLVNVFIVGWAFGKFRSVSEFMSYLGLGKVHEPYEIEEPNWGYPPSVDGSNPPPPYEEA